jgi:hypothetical protein
MTSSQVLRVANGRPHSEFRAAVALVFTMLLAPPCLAQSPPPIQGTMALEGTMKKFYRAANVVIVTTIDGVEHVYQFTKDLVVHGGRGPGLDALEGLREGHTVVVHYSGLGAESAVREVDVVGDEGLVVTEGMVSRIDQRRRQIVVRYDNGKTETFRLTERAASEAPKDTEPAARAGTKVVIYYVDEHGQKVAHFFRKVSN